MKFILDLENKFKNFSDPKLFNNIFLNIFKIGLKKCYRS